MASIFVSLCVTACHLLFICLLLSYHTNKSPNLMKFIRSHSQPNRSLNSDGLRFPPRLFCVCGILPAKAIPEMTYTVSGVMLNPTHSLTYSDQIIRSMCGFSLKDMCGVLCQVL